MAYWELNIVSLDFNNRQLTQYMDPIFYGLHELFRDCVDPLRMSESVKELLATGSDANGVDCQGDTPLSLLVLHVNRGLKFHRHRINELKVLEDDGVSDQKIYDVCVDVDAQYQYQVFSCLEMLLRHGTIANVVPKTCPSVIHHTEWNELFELKLIQSEMRWTLLSFGVSMEFTTYNVFNPLSPKREANSRGVHIIHMLAWRGDAQCFELLLQHCSVDVNFCTIDGWNALHFLYFYCNKPSDLVSMTKLLINAGVNVNQMDRKGFTPMYLLLCHILVKRSHIKYLANAYSHDYVILSKASDNYCEEIRQCLVLLIGAGAAVNVHACGITETSLHFMFERFEHSLLNCQEEFQTKGHLLVPYAFQLQPILKFVNFFVRLQDINVNSYNGHGQTALHVLASSLRNLSLDEELNPAGVLVDVFLALLKAGANPNLKDLNQRTVGYKMVEVATSRRGAVQRYLPVLQALLDYGADFSQVNRSGNSVLHVAVNGSIKQVERLELLLFLLRCGANPNTINHSLETPLCQLLQEHIVHHRDGITQLLCLDVFFRMIDILCQTMSMESLNRVASKYLTSSFCSVFCQSGCYVHQLLFRYHTTPRLLSELCRLTVWQCLGRRFIRHCQKDLPVPKKLSNYIFQLVS